LKNDVGVFGKKLDDAVLIERMPAEHQLFADRDLPLTRIELRAEILVERPVRSADEPNPVSRRQPRLDEHHLVRAGSRLEVVVDGIRAQAKLNSLPEDEGGQEREPDHRDPRRDQARATGAADHRQKSEADEQRARSKDNGGNGVHYFPSAACRSQARHRYHAAAERWGRHRSPNSSVSLKVGSSFIL